MTQCLTAWPGKEYSTTRSRVGKYTKLIGLKILIGSKPSISKKSGKLHLTMVVWWVNFHHTRSNTHKMVNSYLLKKLKDRFGKAKGVSGGSYRVCCPTCDPKDSKKMKRYISPGWAVSNCFICGQMLKVSDLLKGDALEFQSFSSSEVDQQEDYPHAKTPPYTDIVGFESLDENHPAVQFLKKDHLTNFEYYFYLGVGYIPQSGGINISFDSGFKINTAESIHFPIIHRGEYVGWQLRFIPGTFNGDRLQYMRYLHLFPKGDYLFNYDVAKKFDHLIVVEGAKKALKCMNAVATLGKGISSNQKQLIQEWKKITIMLDGEDATQEKARELAEEFNANGRKCINVDPRDYGFSSPDEATTEDLKKIIKDIWTK